MVRVNGLHDGCYLRPLVYLGYGEMGLNPLPCPVNVSIAAWPWGTYLGDEGVANGVSCKISSWQRHDPNAVPTAAKGTGMYVNSSLAKVEALKAGYDEAILLAPNGRRQRVHRREHLHRPRRRASSRRRPPTPARSRASPRTRSRPSPATSGYEVRHEHIIRTDLYLADEAFLTGTAAEVVPIRAVDDRPVGAGHARADHQGDPADLLRHRARRGRPVQGLAGPCRLTGRRRRPQPRRRTAHPRARPQRPRPRLRRARAARGRRHLRHHPARRQPAGGPLAHRRRQAPGGRAARPPRRRPSSRAAGPGANPKDVEFFARAKKELTLGTATLVAFGSTRRAGVKPEDDAVLRQPASTPGRRSPASWPSRGTATSPRRCAPPSTRRWPWWPTRCASCASTTCGSSSTPSTSSTATGAIPTSRCRVLAAAEEAGAEALVLCDTNGGSLPDDVGAGGGRRAGPHRAPARASTATTTPAAPWPTRWWRCRRGPPRCRAASTATASGRATPTSRPPSPTCRSSSTSAPSRPTAWSG